MEAEECQIPNSGTLSILDEAKDWTGVCDTLYYGGNRHLRKCFRIPIDLLHYNIENGRYRTRFLLLQKANPGVVIDEKEQHWRDEILKLLNGTWVDPKTGVGTQKERGHFLALVADIKDRGQERPGIVLETGGVMSGNRRLAALKTLFDETQNPRYRSFEAFIIPSEGGMTNADRWRLEMSAQLGQGRLLRSYDAVDKLLKMKEGVDYLISENPDGGFESAVRAVANDFASDEETIRGDLQSLHYIEEYLTTIGHPEEWWRANELTEIFTEFGPLMRACETNAVSHEDRSKLKRVIFQIVRDGNADYRLIRDVRAAVGPVQRRKNVRRIPTAVKVLIDNAPNSAELLHEHTDTKTEQTVELFRSEFQAGKEQEAPIVKAQRAETNLKNLLEVLKQDKNKETKYPEPSLIESVSNCKTLAEQALHIIQH